MKAKKQFGQHFLKDAETIKAIMAAANPLDGESFVEIGPGRGALTESLLARGVCLTAVEIDRDCLAYLRGKFGAAITARQLSLIESDILHWQLPKHRQRWIGNLPYNISSTLLLKLCNSDVMADGFFMLQKEVAMRLCAAVGDADYGRLTVAVRSTFAAEVLLEVAPCCFVPPPKVHSAVVRLRPLSAPMPHPPGFEEVLRAAFQSRRKTLRNALRDFNVDWQSAKINPDLRPQNLSPLDYTNLAKHSNPKN